MENIWKHGLVPFESEGEIAEAEKEFEETYQVDLKYLVIREKSKPPIDAVLPAYYITKAWTPFVDCGREPQELYTILQCNALVCALIAFSYLDKNNDREVLDLISQEKKKDLHTGVVEDILSDAYTHLKRNAAQEYLGNCLLYMVYKQDKQKKTKPVFSPVVEAILWKKFEENYKRRDSEEKIDNLFRTLRNTYATYCGEGCSSKSKSDSPKPVSPESERQRRHRLCVAYDCFYKEWMDMSAYVPESGNIKDDPTGEFLKELVFHHRALARCEKSFERLSERKGFALKGELDIDVEASNIAETLLCACQIPLVFGADKLQFRKRQTWRAFGQYCDFIKLTIILFYERTDHNLKAAYSLVKECLKDSKFDDLISFAEKSKDHYDMNLHERNLIKRAAAAAAGMAKLNYFGKGNTEYAMTQDEYFSIFTENSHLEEGKAHLFTGKVQKHCKPQTVEPDIKIGVAYFKCKEDRDAFLADPTLIKESVAMSLGADSDQLVLAVPKDDSPSLDPSNFKQIIK